MLRGRAEGASTSQEAYPACDHTTEPGSGRPVRPGRNRPTWLKARAPDCLPPALPGGSTPPAIEHPCHQGVTSKLMMKLRAQAASADGGWAVPWEGFWRCVTKKTKFKPLLITILR